MRQRDATAASTPSAEYGRILSPGRAAISMGIGAIAALVPALLGEPTQPEPAHRLDRGRNCGAALGLENQLVSEC